MPGHTRSLPSVASSSADNYTSPTSPTFGSQYTQSSSDPRTATESSAPSEMSTSPVQPETPTDQLAYDDGVDACSVDPEYWLHSQEQKNEDEEVVVSDALPTPAELEKAGDLLVYDANGVGRPFKSLYKGVEHQGQRQMILFVRHFYCGACQHYLKALTETITPSVYFGLPTPTTISIIGCGRPDLIPQYTTRTTCPFRVYADPSRKLYKTLGMRWTVRIGKRPEYIPMNVIKLVADSLAQMVREPRRDVWDGRKLVAGPFTQIGGEFLFEDGQPIWCHRMRNVRNHTEMSALKKVLEMEGENDADSAIVEQATVIPMSPTVAHSGLKMVWDGTEGKEQMQRESGLFEQY